MAQALYVQAAEYIREKIAEGEYPVGSQIPTENELAAQLGVSRPTEIGRASCRERVLRLV